MRWRVIHWLIGLVVLAACQTEVSLRTIQDLPAEPSGSENSHTDQVQLPPEGEGGRLAYLGADGNVYVTSADRTITVAVTEDASTFSEGNGLSYQRLSWSPDGFLAYASVHREQDSASSKLFVLGNGMPVPLQVADSEDHFVIYIYWSPVACPGIPNCRQLAYLIEEDEGFSLRAVRLEPDGLDNRLLGQGWPFYYSWSPGGNSILWHTEGAGRQNPAARLVHYDTERNLAQRDAADPGLFQAPAWSPQGDSWLTVTSLGNLDQLQLIVDAGRITIDSVTNRQLTFVWSPDGQQVAFASRIRSNDPFYGSIHIFDLESGKSRRITDLGFRILGFFWSPTGDRIAYLTYQELPQAIWNQWRVYDLSTDIDRGYKSFHPTAQWDFVIRSFNQYAQSHRLWSPDGRFLVYTDQAGSTSRIWMIDTWSEDGTEAIFVAEGVIAFWSWN